jgi:hypothetical protein
MEREMLMEYMDAWARSMRHEDSGLGYPKKSIMMSSGGNYTSFEDMIEESDGKVIETIDAVISSLDQDQRDAVWARWLNTKKPMYYELKLSHAIDNLLTIVGRRLGI